MRKSWVIVIAAVALSSCVYQRAKDAGEAQAKLVGFSKAEVLACMGPPANRATEENIEVWTDVVHALLVNRSERHAMARAALEEARQHSVERFSTDIARVYQTAIGARSKSKRNGALRSS